MPPKPPSVEGDLTEGFLEWGTGYALNNLARAQDNGNFVSVLEQLQVGCGDVGCAEVVGKWEGWVVALRFFFASVGGFGMYCFLVHPACSYSNSIAHLV